MAAGQAKSNSAQNRVSKQVPENFDAKLRLFKILSRFYDFKI